MSTSILILSIHKTTDFFLLVNNELDKH